MIESGLRLRLLLLALLAATCCMTGVFASLGAESSKSTGFVAPNTVASTRSLPAILDEPLVAGQHTLDAAIDNLPALSRVRFSAKPQFEAGLRPLGEARRYTAIDGDIAIGTRAFSSRTQLTGTLVHEEAHLRFFRRLKLNGPNSRAARIGLEGEEAYIRAVEARFLRMKGLIGE